MFQARLWTSRQVAPPVRSDPQRYVSATQMTFHSFGVVEDGLRFGCFGTPRCCSTSFRVFLSNRTQNPRTTLSSHAAGQCRVWGGAACEGLQPLSLSARINVCLVPFWAYEGAVYARQTDPDAPRTPRPSGRPEVPLLRVVVCGKPLQFGAPAPPLNPSHRFRKPQAPFPSFPQGKKRTNTYSTAEVEELGITCFAVLAHCWGSWPYRSKDPEHSLLAKCSRCQLVRYRIDHWVCWGRESYWGRRLGIRGRGKRTCPTA